MDRAAVWMLCVGVGVLACEGAAAQDLPPTGLDLAPPGRVSIRRIEKPKRSLAKVEPVRAPGNGRKTSLSVLQLRSVTLHQALVATCAPQQVALQGERFLPGGNYDIDVFVWPDSRDIAPKLVQAVSESFDLTVELTEQMKTVYVMRLQKEKKPRRKPLFGIKITRGRAPGTRMYSLKGEPAKIAATLRQPLNNLVIDETGSTEPLQLTLFLSNPPTHREIVSQAAEQGVLLERESRRVPAIRVTPVSP